MKVLSTLATLMITTSALSQQIPNAQKGDMVVYFNKKGEAQAATVMSSTPGVKGIPTLRIEDNNDKDLLKTQLIGYERNGLDISQNQILDKEVANEGQIRPGKIVSTCHGEAKVIRLFKDKAMEINTSKGVVRSFLHIDAEDNCGKTADGTWMVVEVLEGVNKGKQKVVKTHIVTQGNVPTVKSGYTLDI